MLKTHTPLGYIPEEVDSSQEHRSTQDLPLAGALGASILRVIRLRQIIERGMRHRWLGPLFFLLLVLLLVMTALHAVHDGDHIASGAGDVCLGIAIMLGAVIVIRLRHLAQLPAALPALGRAPPAPRVLVPRSLALRSTPIPLRL